MIPIIVINKNFYAYNYFDDFEALDGWCRYEIKEDKLRLKVLELLHKEVAGCFLHTKNVSNKDAYNRTYYTRAYVTDQIKFQIYLSEIIEKAKGELI